MIHLIDKDALVADIDNILDYIDEHWDTDYAIGAKRFADKLQDAIDTLEVKEVDIDKLYEFRKSVGFAYTEGASEYQNQLACYRQGIEDVIKALKGE